MNKRFGNSLMMIKSVSRPGGKVTGTLQYLEGLTDKQLELTRDMSYSETAALAKQTEEAGLVREMRMDVAQQLLQMLAAATRQPAPEPAASAASAS